MTELDWLRLRVWALVQDLRATALARPDALARAHRAGLLAVPAMLRRPFPRRSKANRIRVGRPKGKPSGAERSAWPSGQPFNAPFADLAGVPLTHGTPKCKFMNGENYG